MKKILLVILATSSLSSFAGTIPGTKVQTTKAFDSFINQVSGDVNALNDAQIAKNDEYKRFNYNLVMNAKGNGKGLGTTFLNSYQAKAYPYLAKANQIIMNINPNGSLNDLNQAITTAQTQLNQYQDARQALFSDKAIQADGYFIVNREANAFLCSLQNSEKQSTKKKWFSFIVNAKKYADCVVAHEANSSLDLDKKAITYANTMTATTSIANVILSNATYFTGDQFANRVNSFVINQTNDTKQAVDNAKTYTAAQIAEAKKVFADNVNNKSCNAAMDSFRVSYADAAVNNNKLRMISLASQPKSVVRTAVNIFGADKGNMISDALNVAHVYLTGTQVQDTNKDYDICSYDTYKANKGKNVYAGKFINFDEVSAKTKGIITPEQAYQLFVITSAKSTEYVVKDKNSGSATLFN